MTTMFLTDVFRDPDKYVESIDQDAYIDFFDGKNTFKNVQELTPDDISKALEQLLDADLVLSFIRKSPLNQEEPNFIHKDDIHGDYTAILYLNKKYPEGYGTTLYDDDENEMLVCKAKYNSLFVFPSSVNHSRNIEQNFGEGDESRLIRVMFFKSRA